MNQAQNGQISAKFAPTNHLHNVIVNSTMSIADVSQSVPISNYQAVLM